MNNKLLNIFGEIEEIKISSGDWFSLHNHRKEHFFKKDYKTFLDKHNLKPTYFNLNCLDMLKGVILTDAQILNLEESIKGGLKK